MSDEIEEVETEGQWTRRPIRIHLNSEKGPAICSCGGR